MIAITFHFTGGRCHATPWGRHVNEGLVEWPPSPWRILRSLIACYHRKGRHLSEPMVQSVIEKMTALPGYHLPTASLGHTRHYMPQRDPQGKDKTKVFDAFAAVSEPLVVIWPEVHLDAEERRVLGTLLQSLSYLGRAESWVEARLLEEWSGEVNCYPLEEGIPAGREAVSLLAAEVPDDYLAWVESTAPVAVAAGGSRRGRGSKTATLVPPDLWTALHAETGTLQQQGWSAPPGSRWVEYARPSDAFQVTYEPQQASGKALHPTVARFALAGAVLPRLTDAVALGERMRQALMAHTRGVADSGLALALFSGRASDGTPLDGDHSHAFFLAADDDGDGRIDHITVHVPAGLPRQAQVVLSRLRTLWGAGGHDIFAVLVGMGQPENYGGFDVIEGRTPQLAAARVWVSRTPYLLTRHPKAYRNGRPKLGADGLQIDGPEAQLRAELTNRGFPAPVRVESVRHTEMGGKQVRWLEFRRERRTGGGRLASPVGYGFRLTFAEPVRGPIALGYGCHFGLGQFIALK